MINILIVEDNTTKLGKILSVIKEEIDVPLDNIDKAKTIKEAKYKIKSKQFDLMILDLVLPVDEGDEEKPENGIEFLKTIQTSPLIKHPPIHIVGLTGFADLRDQYEDEFKKYLWHLIDYKENETDWKDKLKQIIYHLVKVRRDFLMNNNSYDYDIAILTALNEELDQVLRIEAGWEDYKVENDATTYHIGYFQKEEKKLKVICASAPQMGMVASATLAMKMINSFRPKYIIMTGIAAGYKSSDLSQGDILIIDQSYDGTSGKISTLDNGETKFEPNPTPIPLDSDIKESIREYENKVELFSLIKKDFNGNTPNEELKCKVGPVVSVPYVVSNQDKFLEFKDVQRKLIGLDMEAYGVFYSAINTTNPKPKAIVIKSISDFGDKNKGDDFHKYAAYTSARFMYEFVLNTL